MKTLFVYGVKSKCPRETLETEFARCGEVTDVSITEKGYAFVTMAEDSSADAACQELNGAVIDGKKVRVERAHGRGAQGGGARGGGARHVTVGRVGGRGGGPMAMGGRGGGPMAGRGGGLGVGDRRGRGGGDRRGSGLGGGRSGGRRGGRGGGGSSLPPPYQIQPNQQPPQPPQHPQPPQLQQQQPQPPQHPQPPQLQQQQPNRQVNMHYL